MRLGRDYTNFLVYDYLSDEEKRGVASGQIDLVSMNALALKKAKSDVKRQIELTRELGFSHIELDADSPNPYLNFSAEQKKAIREMAEANNITLSIHLPYSYIGSCICCPQKSDRKIAIELHRRYLEFASDLGAKYAVIHPGSVPPYQSTGKYREHARHALIESLVELSKFVPDLGLALCLENNTAFDGIFSEPEECMSIIQEIREQGAGIYFNFDIGHWLTRADIGMPISEPPESVLEPLPPDALKELHLNDYVLGERKFHPPLYLGWGALKRGNLERYARIVKRKGVEVIVLETALQNIEQVFDRKEILIAESRYIRGIFEGV
jgi:sugar phosphate isomerase/epimerase